MSTNPAITNCLNCNTQIYEYNRHTCSECSASVCFYCETQHAANHLTDKEDLDAKVQEETSGN